MNRCDYERLYEDVNFYWDGTVGGLTTFSRDCVILGFDLTNAYVKTLLENGGKADKGELFRLLKLDYCS